METVGKTYKSKRSAINYAKQQWVGPTVSDRHDWAVIVKGSGDSWQCYIANADNWCYTCHDTYRNCPDALTCGCPGQES